MIRAQFRGNLRAAHTPRNALIKSKSALRFGDSVRLDALIRELVTVILNEVLEFHARGPDERLPGGDRGAEAESLIALQDFVPELEHFLIFPLLIGDLAVE